MNNQPILFYSTRCSHSAQIMNTLKALNKESLCRYVSIDGKGRHELPDFLKSVPTLYVPESKDVYIGKEIYAYIAKPVAARREIPTETPAQKASAAPPPAPGSVSEYQAWSFEGTRGLTEGYASWTNPGAFSSDNQLNFTFLTGGAVGGAPEPQTKQSSDGPKTSRNDDITARLEEYKKTRESEFKGITRQ